MKSLILAAFIALSLLSVAAQAQSYNHGTPHGSYDNTGRGPQQSGLEGGGG